jgi:hypothetical protein
VQYIGLPCPTDRPAFKFRCIWPRHLESATAKPPGGPAPKQLLGTWKTRLTTADVAKADKEGMPAGNPTWLLVILNSGVGNSPRVLGLRPVGEQLSAPTIPFGVQGQLIYLQCLNAGAGLPIAGHDTFRWSVSGGSLRLRPVRLVCKKNPFDRNRAVILASEPWRRGR